MTKCSILTFLTQVLSSLSRAEQRWHFCAVIHFTFLTHVACKLRSRYTFTLLIGFSRTPVFCLLFIFVFIIIYILFCLFDDPVAVRSAESRRRYRRVVGSSLRLKIVNRSQATRIQYTYTQTCTRFHQTNYISMIMYDSRTLVSVIFMPVV